MKNYPAPAQVLGINSSPSNPPYFRFRPLGTGGLGRSMPGSLPRQLVVCSFRVLPNHPPPQRHTTVTDRARRAGVSTFARRLAS